MFKSLLWPTLNTSAHRLLAQRFLRGHKGRTKGTTTNDDEDFSRLTEEQKDQLLRTSEEFEAIQALIAKSRESPRMFEEISRNEKQIRHWLKKKIVERKYVKKAPEVNFLTYDAKEQIRFLHHQDPEEWSVERLAESFPVSVQGVKKLLKSKCKLRSREEVEAHDRRVLKHWRERATECQIASRYLNSARQSGTSLSALGGVNSALPVREHEGSTEYLYKRPPRKVGQFESMVIQHLNAGGGVRGSDGSSVDGGYDGSSIDGGYDGSSVGGGYDGRSVDEEVRATNGRGSTREKQSRK